MIVNSLANRGFVKHADNPNERRYQSVL